MNYFKICIVIIFCVTATTKIVFAEDSREDLNKARSLVEQKSYENALKIYGAISGLLKSDPDFLIEWARVNTYADRHSEAISLFEQVRREHPEKEREILRELADQYKWSNQLKKSIETYRRAQELNIKDEQIEIGLAQALAWDGQHKKAIGQYDAVLKSDPGSVSAMLGKAEVLSWDDKLEEANRIYDNVLNKEASNLKALNGLARNNVWQGYHKKGIKLYKDILNKNPGNPDALEGIAYAYHWDNQDTLALKTLDELLVSYPEREAARNLYDKIQGANKLHISQSNRYSYDSNHLRIFSERLHAGKRINNETELGGTYEWVYYKQPGYASVDGNRAGVDIRKRFNEYIEINSYSYLSKYNSRGFTPFTTNTWLTLTPNDLWRFDVSYDRETFEDVGSLFNKIITNSGSISADFKPNRFWLFSSKYKRSRYSDDNNQDTVFSRAEFRLNQDPYIKLYYNYYYSHWSEMKDHGYFNPKHISANTAGLYASKQLTKKLFTEGQISIGYENQYPKSNHPTYFAALGLMYQVNKNWALSLRGEYFNALDTNPKKEYSKKSAWLGITYNFGPEPARPYEAQQPARPTGAR